MQKIGFVIVVAWSLLCMSCKDTVFFAYDGTTLIISSDKAYLGTNGDRAQIRVIGITEDGRPVHDYTMVMFSATLGTITSSTEFMNGSATVEFISGNQSGTAEITARSGNNVSDTLEIIIGSGALAILTLNAEPAVLGPGGGDSLISVHAFDAAMNTLAGVPVMLSANSGTLSRGSEIRLTDENGLVRDSLYTENTATVTALSGSISKSITVTVEENQLPSCEFSISPTSAFIGQKVFFNAGLSSDSDGEIVDWQWDFGDGNTAEGETASHRYRVAGIYSIILVVTDNDGGGSSSQKSLTITENFD